MSSVSAVLRYLRKVVFNTADFTNGYNLQLENPNANAQIVILFTNSGNPVAKIRADYAGNISYIAFAGGHQWYIGGDFGVGTPVFNIPNVAGPVNADYGYSASGQVGVNNSFQTGDGRTATVTGGIITSIS